MSMKEFLTDIAVKMITYILALFIAAESISLFGAGSIIAKPRFNWIAIIFIAVVFELWGMYKGKTLKAFKKDTPLP